MNFKTHLAILTIMLFSISNLSAHDFWLEANPFYSKPGTNVDISILVGEDMFGETLPNIPADYSDFSYTTKKGRKKISGEIARYPAGYFEVSEAGYYAIGYRATEREVSLEGEKFTDYLKKQGLDKIIAFREKNQLTDRKVNEIYSRCVKTIVKVGEDSHNDYSQQQFGYTLEITPLENPYDKKIGDTLGIKVSYLGQALNDTLVSAFTKESPQNKQKVRTNSHGIAEININKKGRWLLTSVEMIPSQKEFVDWESFWASLSFELR